ncbi:uncharacterized protein BT62DRAFT_758619 [Guyanagaster necrorhizus]|uniref:GTP binding protein 2 n=1 Tax=Guyanagaster necrorhizus TaxID=856835 RepID=A0A9P8AU78_9AGAR|nr:uncharacterized protein BT62DRAFT_758619 [Guyanagaster necrorhizus MCA 3950]KAG7448204.1 hypothetical protein BT62DRAFT_758619 [Guyanagaster necrorhizus MCA 3950]
MFGESESESPRVPSPWDSLISTPASSSPLCGPVFSASPVVTTIPKLVPEADDGNVEYKLQLLSPSPPRFARLVTQLKWRLLEGGGQAYYELGVADSGALVGLPRADLEQTLETLEMMAGEIGASVIVVKEIEVPAALATLAVLEDSNDGARRERMTEFKVGSEGTTTGTETETELSTTDAEDAGEGVPPGTLSLHQRSLLCSTPGSSSSSVDVFSMDIESDTAEQADTESDSESSPPQHKFSIDVEISSVFKPRPFRTRVTSTPVALSSAEMKCNNRGAKKKVKHHLHDVFTSSSAPSLMPTDEQRKNTKGLNRRQARDRRREERRKALMAFASNSIEPPQAADQLVDVTNGTEESATQEMGLNDKAVPDSTDVLVSGLGELHASVDHQPVSAGPPTVTAEENIPSISLVELEDDDVTGDDDVFAPPTPSVPYTSVASAGAEEGKDQPRLIVEALVVRKMSIEEAFLDFGGFSLS